MICRGLTISILSTAAVSDSGGGPAHYPPWLPMQKSQRKLCKVRSDTKTQTGDGRNFASRSEPLLCTMSYLQCLRPCRLGRPLAPRISMLGGRGCEALAKFRSVKPPSLETHTEDPTYINIEIRGNGVCTNAQSLFGSTCEISSVTSYELFRTVPTTCTKLSIPRNDQ